MIEGPEAASPRAEPTALHDPSATDLLRRIPDHLEDAVVVTDAEGRLVYANAAAVDRYEMDPEASLGVPVEELIRVTSSEGSGWGLAREVVQREGLYHGGVVHTTPSGRHLDVNARITRLLDDDGEPCGYMGVFRDVTASRAAELVAIENEQYLSVALRNMPLIASIVDRDLRYVWLHKPHPDFDPDVTLGRTARAALSEADAEAVLNAKREAMEGRTRVRRVIPLQLSDGAHLFDITSDPIFDEDGEVTGVASVGLDVTEERRMAEQLRQAKVRAEAANESKSAFLAAMSHELRTPLSAITGYADLLEMGVPTRVPAEAQDYLRRIRVSARHLLELIEEVLTYARMEAHQDPMEVAPLDTRELVEEIRAILGPRIDAKGLEFKVELRGDHVGVPTDSRKVRQVLLNLVGNAVKFTEAGSVSLLADRTADRLRLEVSDSGEGIEPQHLDSLFEPFWQGPRRAGRIEEGTGLGLTIVKRSVDLLGGLIRVRTRPGVGSVFTVDIPLVAQ
ncbi:MAG TPA: ATP-binding protein [Longimicrobiales bacterium]|nr:ATP-binding protein [Longimicrobiales bacterium]